MIEFAHNFDGFAKELENLSEKQFNGIFKRSMTRALKAGAKESQKLLSKVINKPRKHGSFPMYFKQETRVSKVYGRVDQFTGYLWFSSKRSGLEQYTTQAKLEAHRKAVNKRGWKKRGQGKKVTPVRVKLTPGRTTVLRKAFAGKSRGKGTFQIFRRKSGGARAKLNRPTASSLKSTIESHPIIEAATNSKMRRRYFIEFRNNLRFRSNQALARAGKSRLKSA